MSLFTNIYPTKYDVPDNVKNFQDDVTGVGAIVEAVREMIAGDVDEAVFLIGKHDGFKWVEKGGFRIEMDTIHGKRCFREGNSSVVASHNPHALDDAYVVGCLVSRFGHNVFRQKIKK